MKKNKTALIAGSTGLVGSHLLSQMLEDDFYSKVKIITRRPVDFENSKLEQHKVNFDTIDEYEEVFKDVDDIYCTLGTTIKKAGSKEAFKKVDYYYPLKIAQPGLQNNAKQFLIVTALGADPESKIFYNLVKGEVEEELKKLNYRTLNIFRPSLLLGDRDVTRVKEKIGEIFMKLLSPLMIGKLKKYKPVHASKVAAKMLDTAKHNLSGVNVFESDKIRK